MPVAHKSAISFGLVHIPVGLYTATQDNDVRFNQLCKEDLSRVKYKKVCSGCGKEVDNKDIVKGFEYSGGEYVVVTDDDFEKIKTEKDKTMRILHFTDLASIAPIFYDKTYHLVPEKGGEKAFELLRTAMLEEGKIAVARSVLGSKDTLLAIMPTDGGLLVETMFFDDEIKEIPKAFARPEVNPEELAVAKTLINSMDKPFKASAYKDEYQEKLRDLIQRKINGKEIVRPKSESAPNVIDLMDALQKSLAEQGAAQGESKAESKKEAAEKPAKAAQGAKGAKRSAKAAPKAPSRPAAGKRA